MPTNLSTIVLAQLTILVHSCMTIYIWSFSFSNRISSLTENKKYVKFDDDICTSRGVIVQMYRLIFMHTHKSERETSLQWHHNEHFVVPNHRRLVCLFSRLLGLTSTKTSKPAWMSDCIPQFNVDVIVYPWKNDSPCDALGWYCKSANWPSYLFSLSSRNCFSQSLLGPGACIMTVWWQQCGYWFRRSEGQELSQRA